MIRWGAVVPRSAACNVVMPQQDGSPWIIIDLFRAFAVHGVVVRPCLDWPTRCDVLASGCAATLCIIYVNMNHQISGW
jgi:hypothetical protein